MTHPTTRAVTKTAPGSSNAWAPTTPTRCTSGICCKSASSIRWWAAWSAGSAQLGVYDQALVIVTADHGASYRESTPRRGISVRNLADIVRVPLFIKLPGQRDGAIVDGIAESVDVLPTIADVLGMRLPFPVDGRSLVGERQARTSRTFIDRSVAADCHAVT